MRSKIVVIIRPTVYLSKVDVAAQISDRSREEVKWKREEPQTWQSGAPLASPWPLFHDFHYQICWISLSRIALFLSRLALDYSPCLSQSSSLLLPDQACMWRWHTLQVYELTCSAKGAHPRVLIQGCSPRRYSPTKSEPTMRRASS